MESSNQRRSLFPCLLLVLLLLCCLCTVGTIFFIIPTVISTADFSEVTNSYRYEFESGNKDSKNKILVLDVSGVIMDENNESFSLFSEETTYASDIKKYLTDAATDNSIKALIIKINSPGGTVTGSMLIGESIAKFRELTNKPIYAYINGLAASGGYWVAASADKIYANQGSLIGSIGVIFGSPFVYYDKVMAEGSILGGVVTQNGIETFYITAGEYKDIGNPYRPMTEEERQTLQQGINEDYDLFVNHVAKNRKISAETIKAKIKALIYSNNQALDLKLIDANATYDEVLAKLATEANFSDYQVVHIAIADNMFLSLLRNNLAKPKAEIYDSLKNHVLMLFGDPLNYKSN